MAGVVPLAVDESLSFEPARRAVWPPQRQVRCIHDATLCGLSAVAAGPAAVDRTPSMMSPPDGSAVSLTASRLLREATAQQHLAVEQLPAMRALMRDSLSVPDYVQVLRRHHAALAGWEQRESAWLHASGDAAWRYQPRSPLLEQDLAALRATPPLPAPAPPAHDAGSRWGMLYVVEGSRLGGRLIARQLRQSLTDAAPALSYFELGHADPACWRRFQQRLEQALPTPQSRQAAVAGARAMFAHFHTHFALETVA